jgi:type VI secretion system protein ImpI
LTTGLSLRITNTVNNTVVVRIFPQLPVRIGRNTLNDLNILDRFVSQFHAVVELHGDELKLRDLGSSNGTKVGSDRAPAHDPIPLAAHQNAFSIGPLVIEAKLSEVEAPVERSPETADPVSVRDLDAVLEQSFITNINETLAFDNSAIVEARAKFAAAEATAPDPKALGGTLLLDQDDAAKARAALMARVQAHAQAQAQPPQPDAGDAKQRRLEQLALQGVREIARALLPAAGPLDEPEDLVRFLSKVRDTIEVFLRCFIPLREGYRQFATQMDLGRAGNGSSERRVENAKDERELAQHLLDWNNKGPEAHKAIEGTFADLMIHQLALLHAIMRGVKSLLDALSPKSIDVALETLAKEGKTNFSWGPWRFKELWRLYGAKHGDMDDGDKRMFAALFGPDFAESYNQYRSTVDTPEPT